MIVSLVILAAPARAGEVIVHGRPLAGAACIHMEGQYWLPVATVGGALGASVTVSGATVLVDRRPVSCPVRVLRGIAYVPKEAVERAFSVAVTVTDGRAIVMRSGETMPPPGQTSAHVPPGGAQIGQKPPPDGAQPGKMPPPPGGPQQHTPGAGGSPGAAPSPEPHFSNAPGSGIQSTPDPVAPPLPTTPQPSGPFPINIYAESLDRDPTAGDRLRARCAVRNDSGRDLQNVVVTLVFWEQGGSSYDAVTGHAVVSGNGYSAYPVTLGNLASGETKQFSVTTSIGSPDKINQSERLVILDIRHRLEAGDRALAGHALQRGHRDDHENLVSDAGADFGAGRLHARCVEAVPDLEGNLHPGLLIALADAEQAGQLLVAEDEVRLAGAGELHVQDLQLFGHLGHGIVATSRERLHHGIRTERSGECRDVVRQDRRRQHDAQRKGNQKPAYAAHQKLLV